MAKNFYFNGDLGDAIDDFVNNIMKDVEDLVDQESVNNKVREFQAIITDSGLSAAQNSYRKKRESNKSQVKKTKKQTNVINSSFSYSSKSDDKGTDINFRKNTDINLSMSLLKWFQIVLLVNLIFSLKEDYGFGTWIVLAVLLTVADVSKEVSVGATKASQRGVVDMDTMKYMYEKVLETANEMRQIEEEGRATREQSERELLSMEQEYSGSLVDYSK